MKIRGFTIIELMVVIVILGILISIFFSARSHLISGTPTPSTARVEKRDLSECSFLGLDQNDLNVYKCADGKIYTSR